MYPHRHTPSDGVLEIPYQDFPGTYQRTNTVPAECPNAAIVWVNSIDQLVQAGTSWYELVRAGTEVTHRRENGTKIGNFTLFADTNWLVRWYAGTVPDRYQGAAGLGEGGGQHKTSARSVGVAKRRRTSRRAYAKRDISSTRIAVTSVLSTND
jgi:hypothetical protein